MGAPEHVRDAEVTEAVAALPGATAAEVAGALGIGRSTAAKRLARLETAGVLQRSPGGRSAGAKVADRWFPAPVGAGAPPEQAPDEDRAPAGDAAATDAPGADAAAAESSAPEAPGRLAPGALGALVREYLAARPNQSFGPSGIAKALGRSAGAVSNLCRSSLSSATADEVAEAVGISAAAASEVLADLEREGLVSRSAGGRQGGSRQSDRWSLTGQSPAVSSGGRLGRGQLREMLVEHLRAHPGEVSPAQLSKVLEHSAGAISNALVKLADAGQVVQTSEHPRRYAAR